MTDELEVPGRIVDSKVAEKAYDDGISGALREVGKFGTDIAKTARLFTAPFRIAAMFQDRLARFLKELAERVPEDRRIDVPPQVSGPAFQAMRYIDEEDILWSMFTELLCKAADKDSVSLVHPAFVQILQQLTRDEAYLLARLRQGPFHIVDTLDFIQSENRFHNLRIISSEIPYNDLHNAEAFNIYHSHLESLSLVTWPVTKQEPIYGQDGFQTAVERKSQIHLTEFGQLLVDACVGKLNNEE